MEYFYQFIFSIFASLVAGYILAILPLGKIDKILPLKKMSFLGIIKIFPNQEKAIKQIFQDCIKSKFVYLFAMKGATFSNPDNNLHQILSITKERKYLISSLTNHYVPLRGSELNMNMSSALKLSIDNFETEKKNNPKIELLLHDEVLRFRLIILDECLYLSFQEKNKPGKESPVLKIKKHSPLYETFITLFFNFWSKYSNPPNS
jgi:hypothetical protein